MTDIATAIVWLTGSVFALLAALGVLRMPDVFTRMQASTKASTLGLGCLLIGAALQMGDFASFIRIACIGAFVLLTTPVAGHVIARASYFSDVPLWKGTVLDERRRDAGAAAQEGGAEDPDMSRRISSQSPLDGSPKPRP
jgi:multicomponent Na+:H+ antiporter subunit G